MPFLVYFLTRIISKVTPMAKIKNIEAYCNFCTAVTKMELTGNIALGGEETQRWAKCKKCKQTTIISLDSIGKEAKPSVKNIEEDSAINYSPSMNYDVGQAIYHEKWDDHGVVIAKEQLSDGKGSIQVEFRNHGVRKLLETPIVQQ